MEPLLKTKDVAKLLGLTDWTLKQMRATGTGPPWIRIGTRVIRYDPAHIRDWQRQLTHQTAPA